MMLQNMIMYIYLKSHNVHYVKLCVLGAPFISAFIDFVCRVEKIWHSVGLISTECHIFTDEILSKVAVPFVIIYEGSINESVSARRWIISREIPISGG